MISTEEFSPISDHTVAGDEFQDKGSTVAMDNNSPEQSTKEINSTVASLAEPSFTIQTTGSTNENWVNMNSEAETIQSTSTVTNNDGKSVSNGTTLEYGTEETDMYSSTASKAWTEMPSVSSQKTHNVQTSTDIPWIEVTTVPHQNVSEFQERMENTEITSAFPDVESQLDCNSLIIILSSTFAVILLLVSIGCLCGLWKIRRTWRRKFEEKHKLDVWAKSTTDNTIVNENYDFYDTDVPMQRGENLRQPEIDTSITISDAQSSSAAKRSSTASTGSRLSKLLPSKLFIGRSKSSYSDDSLIVKDPDARGRASTFTHGKRTKIKHDTHKLVDHIEAGEPHGILETVDNILKPQNKHIVTEL